MSETKKAPARKPATKKTVKNLHVEVPEEFHRKVKMLTVMQGITLKDYALTALREKVARDEEEMKKK
jgi:predicted HicB family RNase H-like nuclease